MDFQLVITAFQIIFILSIYFLSIITKKIKKYLLILIGLQSLALLLFYPPFAKFYSLIIFITSFSFLFRLDIWEVGSQEKNLEIIPRYLGQNIFLKSNSVGILMVIAALLSEYYLFDRNLSFNSQILIILGLIWMSLVYFPKSFSKEFEFLFIFTNIFVLLLLLPLALYKLLTFNMQEDVLYYSSFLTQSFLLNPLESILRVLGYNVWSQNNSLYYENIEAGKVSSVVIAAECSGFYSIIIFISALVSYVIQNKIFNLDTMVLLSLGIFFCYISNIIRMVILVLIGHYYGSEALSWYHSNLGWFIFTFFIFLFWVLIIDPYQKKFSKIS